MSDGGKGSNPRPLSVPREQFDAAFDAIFRKPEPHDLGPMADCDCEPGDCKALTVRACKNLDNRGGKP